MDTRIFHLDEINQAAKAIQDGKLVAFPTETVYGLGADATNEAAVKNVYLAKGRPSDNPLIVHVASVEMVERYASVIPDNARKLMKKFWPGSLTIILNIKKGVLSKTVTGGLSTVAFRFPDCQPTLDLIKKYRLLVRQLILLGSLVQQLLNTFIMIFMGKLRESLIMALLGWVLSQQFLICQLIILLFCVPERSQSIRLKR